MIYIQKLKKSYHWCFSILLCLFTFTSFSQEEDFQHTIHSPQVNAFAKFIDFPISLYTGQAEVSVPIYNLQVGDISLPISLRYHTAGVRIEDIASWVGTNWSLNAGGQITRNIYGTPDFDRLFFDKVPPFVLDYNTQNEIASAAFGSLDSEHDIFHYSAGGYSGKFIIDHINGGEIVTIPKEDILVELNFAEMKITTPDGITYIYGMTEKNRQRFRCTSGTSSPSFNELEPLSWFLTRIESGTTQAYIDLNYEYKNLVYDQNGSQTINKSIAFGAAPPDNDCIISNDIDTYRLTSISSSDGQLITFNKGAERKDLLGDYLLDNIIISHENSTSIKQYHLKHKYQRGNSFYDIDSSIFDHIQEQEETENIRLFLMGIEEIDVSNNSIPIFDYTYNINRGLPSRRSFAQDHFGYYNGNGNVGGLVPPTYFNGEYFRGADRNPNLESAIEGSLASVRNGTGGVRTFTYGLNQCSNCNDKAFYIPSSPSYTSYSSNSLMPSSQGAFPVTSEKIISLSGDGEILFSSSSETSYCPGGIGNCNAVLKLFSLHDNGSINELVFDSTDYRFDVDSDGNIDINLDYRFQGDYKMQMTINNSDWLFGQTDEFSLTVRFLEPFELPPGPKDTSGLRVESMELFDPESNNTITRNYIYGSGYMNGLSHYDRIATRYQPNGNTSGGVFVKFLKRSSSPNVAFTKTKGGVVGYNQVTVREPGNGYTQNYYYSSAEHQDQIISFPEISGSYIPLDQSGRVVSAGDILDASDGEWAYPYAIKDEKDWKRGLLKEQLFYTDDGTLIRKIENKYHFYDDIRHSSYDPSKIRTIFGLRSGGEALVHTGSLPEGQLQLNFYQLQSSWYDMDEVIETNYFDNGKEITTTTKYEYSPNQRSVRSTLITDSKGDVVKTTSLYPTDFNTSIANTMKAKNLINPTLSEKRELNEINVSETQKTFAVANGNINLTQSKVFTKDNDNPIVFDISSNDYGNITEVERSEGVPTTYLWGYNERFPVAKIENATIASAEATLTSTELAGIKAGTYSQNALIGILNKIRTGLPNAFVTTYTYDPLIGMTSVTDPRGYTMTYHYDDFNRLEFVKDQDGNLVSENKYNYKN